MECRRILEEQKQQKRNKQSMRRESLMKFGEGMSKGILFVLEAVGEAVANAQAQNQKQADELVALKNKEAEREYNSNKIIKGDIDNLRNHVAKIVQDKDTPDEVKEEGKRLLKSEGGWLFEDTYTCDEYYKFVIEHGL